VLRAAIADYALMQHAPSVLAYSVLQTVGQLFLRRGRADTDVVDVAPSLPTDVGLDAGDVASCTLAVTSFLRATGARLICPAVFH